MSRTTGQRSLPLFKKRGAAMVPAMQVPLSIRSFFEALEKKAHGMEERKMARSEVSDQSWNYADGMQRHNPEFSGFPFWGSGIAAAGTGSGTVIVCRNKKESDLKHLRGAASLITGEKLSSVEILVLWFLVTLCGNYESDPLSPPEGEAVQGGKPPCPPLYGHAPRGEPRRGREHPWPIAHQENFS